MNPWHIIGTLIGWGLLSLIALVFVLCVWVVIGAAIKTVRERRAGKGRTAVFSGKRR